MYWKGCARKCPLSSWRNYSGIFQERLIDIMKNLEEDTKFVRRDFGLTSYRHELTTIRGKALTFQMFTFLSKVSLSN
jgi:hypothetical protein